MGASHQGVRRYWTSADFAPDLACGAPIGRAKSLVMLPQIVVALHVFAVIVWIGSIASAGWMLANRASAPTPEQGKAAAELALGLYRRVAAPAFVLAFAAGLIRLLLDKDVYMKAHWFHGKLTLALVVIALHHVIGARAAKVAKASGAVKSTYDKLRGTAKKNVEAAVPRLGALVQRFSA